MAVPDDAALVAVCCVRAHARACVARVCCARASRACADPRSSDPEPPGVENLLEVPGYLGPPRAVEKLLEISLPRSDGLLTLFDVPYLIVTVGSFLNKAKFEKFAHELRNRPKSSEITLRWIFKKRKIPS